MSIAAGTVWEVRQGGSDSNGGLFLSSQPGAGTDYSQQDAAQLSLTDVVTDGSTTVTSATGGFTAAMVGNGINIAGTCYMIATRSNTNSITVDRTIAVNTGLSAKVGGALASPGFCSGQAVTANQVWIKAGSYTLSSASANVAGGRVSSPGGSAGSPCKWEGYETTRGDKGTKPAIADGGAGGGGIDIFAPAAAYVIFDNIAIAGSNANNSCFSLSSASCRAIRCKTSGVCTGFDVPANYCALLFCEGANTTKTPFSIRADASLTGCVAHGSSVAGFTVSSAVNVARFASCIAHSNTGAGYTVAAGAQGVFDRCTSYSNGGDGFAVSSSGASAGLYALNCLSAGNSGYGFNAASASGFVELINCATYNNSSGATHNLAATEGAIILSADPFVSAPTNFGLNAVLGGGAACRAAGLPAVYPGLSSTVAYPDIGAIQHADAGSGAGGSGRLALSL